MDGKELEVKKWLNRAFFTDKKIKVLAMLLRQCKERAEIVSMCYDGNDKGKSDNAKNGTENALLRIADTEHKLKQQMNELLSIESEVANAIAMLNDDDLETVLTHRYLLFQTIEETAESMNYSTRTVKNKQKKAIEKLCPLLPCFTLRDVV